MSNRLSDRYFWSILERTTEAANQFHIANYVELLITIGATSDSRSRKSEITFTIPSSYWYRPWFDLPNSGKYVDWVDLMSYDLHSFWDRLDPIGSNMYAHTNLTEIKEATNLPWRVGVLPEKVVFGVGFHGSVLYSKFLIAQALAAPSASNYRWVHVLEKGDPWSTSRLWISWRVASSRRETVVARTLLSLDGLMI